MKKATPTTNIYTACSNYVAFLRVEGDNITYANVTDKSVVFGATAPNGIQKRLVIGRVKFMEMANKPEVLEAVDNYNKWNLEGTLKEHGIIIK